MNPDSESPTPSTGPMRIRKLAPRQWRGSKVYVRALARHPPRWAPRRSGCDEMMSLTLPPRPLSQSPPFSLPTMLRAACPGEPLPPLRGLFRQSKRWKSIYILCLQKKLWIQIPPLSQNYYVSVSLCVFISPSSKWVFFPLHLPCVFHKNFAKNQNINIFHVFRAAKKLCKLNVFLCWWLLLSWLNYRTQLFYPSSPRLSLWWQHCHLLTFGSSVI